MVAGLVLIAAIVSLAAIGLRQASADGQPSFLFPWQDGATWYTGEAGFHSNNDAIDFLGEVSYANGARAHPGDQISDAPPDYREQYARLRSPRYANVIYARAATDRESLLWLQYWFWYFYNDERLAFDIGAHEGDWEMIQLRLAGEGGTPDLAVYAQHARAERRPWDLVARATGRPETPLVYVGRGSHTSYFEPGLHVTDVWYDIVDGARPAPAARLEFLDDLPCRNVDHLPDAPKVIGNNHVGRTALQY